ncbi:hypothetical protein HHI36_008211 [Cryptolaemus montrouzieri]|uniref:Uncharacterized protein n=1 Tax=Cryptolaemus montrouzieri TaxID=559131 RepID=A0ABD2MRW0_9CUCU
MPIEATTSASPKSTSAQPSYVATPAIETPDRVDRYIYRGRPHSTAITIRSRSGKGFEHGQLSLRDIAACVVHMKKIITMSAGSVVAKPNEQGTPIRFLNANDKLKAHPSRVLNPAERNYCTTEKEV